MIINRLGLLTLAVASYGIIAAATAQVYPSRPVTMVVPFPAGGSRVSSALRAPRSVLQKFRSESAGRRVFFSNRDDQTGAIVQPTATECAENAFWMSN